MLPHTHLPAGVAIRSGSRRPRTGPELHGFSSLASCLDERGFCKTNYNMQAETSDQKSLIQSVGELLEGNPRRARWSRGARYFLRPRQIVAGSEGWVLT